MDRRFDELLARVEAAEGALKEIHRVIGDAMPPDSDLDNQDVVVVITGILESYGLPFVSDDAFEPAPELPL